MPLSKPDARKPLHKRTYDMQGFIREDGLWDIEGRIRDTKTYTYQNDFRGEMTPDDAIHDMSIRLTIDDGFVIHAIEVSMDGSPYEICSSVQPNFQNMVGARVGPGWRKIIRERLGGIHGCTHMVEMLSAMATVAYQTAYSSKAQTGKEGRTAVSTEPGRKPRLLNSCHAYRADGPVAKKNFPEFYTGPAD